MTLYWCVDYQLPQNQPVQLSSELEDLLLSMCEDLVLRRTDLLTVLETCQLHHKSLMLPPAERLVRQLVEDVYRNSVDQVSVAENGSQLSDRSQLIRHRLHSGLFSNSSWAQKKKIPRTFSGASYPPEPAGIPSGSRESSYGSWRQLNHSPYTDSRHVNCRFDSSMSLNEKKLKDMGPEFIRMLDEPLVVLELPGSIVSKKGKCLSMQRELSVVMPNSQNIMVKCEVKSRGGDVFDMIVAHSNLMEHFYFGLAYIDDNEFFFVDNDTKISKVAPDSWKKVPSTTFVLYFRVKFFVSDISLLLHKLTRHQFYLQLRRDLLEDRLSCHEETALYLAALALQTEYGDCLPEVYGRNFYRPDQYVPKSVMEKRALPFIQAELLRLHTNNAQMLSDESELEFLKVCQQLPEYGLLFHRVTREKKLVDGQIVLGVCAKGVIVYEVKGGCRSTSQTFYWRETATISSSRRKFVIESRGSKKKYTFITERSKVARYLCNLCSSQHKFNNEMNSRQLGHNLVSEENIVQYAMICRAQSSRHKSFSSNETPQEDSGLATPQDESLNKLYDDVAAKIEARIRQQGRSHNQHSQHNSARLHSPACSRRSGSEAGSGSLQTRETPTHLGSSAEREVICVSLKKDPKLGLGIVIVGEDTVGRYDLGIFVASVVPGGPADRDGRIRLGGRLISLNHVSLEGITFSQAAEVLESSPEEVQLIVSQPKVNRSSSLLPSPVLKNGDSQSTLTSDARSAETNMDELVSAMMSPKTRNRLNVPQEIPEVQEVKKGQAPSGQDSVSQSPSMNSIKSDQISVELRKISGSLGISISGGDRTNLHNRGIYIRSLVPGGAAERDGRVHPADRLLQVDGRSFQGISYQQAVEYLSQTGEVVSLVMGRDVNPPRVSPGSDSGSISSASSKQKLNQTPIRTQKVPARVKEFSFCTDDNTQEVTLTKSAAGLGFSFMMCELDPPTQDFGTMVRIKQLFPGQPAERCGRIQEGDVLLSVNGQSLQELSYPKVLKLFKNSPAEVRLALCRPPAGLLPSVDQFPGS